MSSSDESGRGIRGVENAGMTDATRLRAHLSIACSTDFGLSDELLMAYAEEARAAVAAGADAGWIWLAARNIKRAADPESDGRP